MTLFEEAVNLIGGEKMSLPRTISTSQSTRKRSNSYSMEADAEVASSLPAKARSSFPRDRDLEGWETSQHLLLPFAELILFQNGWEALHKAPPPPVLSPATRPSADGEKRVGSLFTE